MAAFEYTALDETGRTRQGVLNGDSARQARSRLRTMGLFPVEVRGVQEQAGKPAGLIASSQVLRDFGWLLCLGAVLALLLGRFLLSRRFIRARFDRMLLDMPFIGRLNRKLHAARLTRSLAILTKSGVPLLESLEISSRMIINIPLRAAVEDAAVYVREGERLHKALEDSGWFPPLLVQMLASGEESGELDDMLARAASYEESELQAVLTAATALFEPLIILIMGAVVLVIVLAILLPIFEMNQLVGM